MTAQFSRLHACRFRCRMSSRHVPRKIRRQRRILNQLERPHRTKRRHRALVRHAASSISIRIGGDHDQSTAADKRGRASDFARVGSHASSSADTLPTGPSRPADHSTKANTRAEPSAEIGYAPAAPIEILEPRAAGGQRQCDPQIKQTA